MTKRKRNVPPTKGMTNLQKKLRAIRKQLGKDHREEWMAMSNNYLVAEGKPVLTEGQFYTISTGDYLSKTNIPLGIKMVKFGREILERIQHEISEV